MDPSPNMPCCQWTVRSCHLCTRYRRSCWWLAVNMGFLRGIRTRCSRVIIIFDGPAQQTNFISSYTYCGRIGPSCRVLVLHWLFVFRGTPVALPVANLPVYHAFGGNDCLSHMSHQHVSGDSSSHALANQRKDLISSPRWIRLSVIQQTKLLMIHVKHSDRNLT